MTLDGDRYLTWDAAYVLGSLTSAERREFEAHLQTCSRCRSAVAELSGVPALLAKLDLDDVRALDAEQADTPPLRPEVLESVLDKVRWRRRRSRLLMSSAVAVAAALLAVGMLIVFRPETIGLQTNTPEASPSMVMTKVGETPINATISMTGFGWGTRIDMACTYGDWGQRDAPPQSLGMVVVNRDGSRSQVATWLGLPGATALPSATTPTPVTEIAAVQLVSAESGDVLLEHQHVNRVGG
ncbi:anti-sigma factor family protein [Mycobacterium deserti]|uniref:Zf-HC2 domain-containing protein n=1 Tax=Mycobacterium deserti TaxID=2978347 RepID=A0ABT2M9R8_9MYCO|nr:zf-HC2 domain-containing protein [Mycobacterium deserti]MCT7658165.1 zf-HC2 domain-containing protein [Mycobacterium deserti]